jgi:hypothetical protein
MIVEILEVNTGEVVDTAELWDDEFHDDDLLMHALDSLDLLDDDVDKYEIERDDEGNAILSRGGHPALKVRESESHDDFDDDYDDDSDDDDYDDDYDDDSDDDSDDPESY